MFRMIQLITLSMLGFMALSCGSAHADLGSSDSVSLLTNSGSSETVSTLFYGKKLIVGPTFYSYKVGSNVGHDALVATDLVASDKYVTDLIMNVNYHTDSGMPPRLLLDDNAQVNGVFNGSGPNDGLKDVNTVAQLKTFYTSYGYYQYQFQNKRGTAQPVLYLGGIGSYSFTK